MYDSTDSSVLELPRPAAAVTRDGPATSVLVVEDDPDTNARCVQALRTMGMQPEVAVTGAEAIERLSRADARFPVVCVDVAHDAVAETARRLRPGARFLFITSDIGDVLKHDGVVLCRPFTSDEFRHAHDAALLDEPMATDPSWTKGADARWPEEEARRTA